MYRFPGGWEFQTEGGALAGRRANFDPASMFFDDAVAHGEAQAGTAGDRFGSEERVEDTRKVFARNTQAGVGDFNLHAAIAASGANFQHAARGHGIARVKEQ